MSRPCDWCAGRGWCPSEEDHFTPVDCPACRGTGSVPGLPPELVSTVCHVGRAVFRAGLVAALLALVGAPAGVAAVAAIAAALATH